MGPRDSSSRFHPYDTSKKPKIHRTNGTRSHNNHGKKNSDALPKPAQSGLSINDLKRRIRDVKRLLSRHADLSPEARIVQERALAGYEKDLKEEQERRQRSEMIKKYHFVRFLDRKTATKELRTAQRRLEKAKEREGENSTKLAKLQSEIDAAQINVSYTIYYPLTEKYISLYPQDKKNNLRQKRNSDDDDEDDNDNNNINNNNNENTDESTSEDAPMSSSDTNTTDSKPPMWHIVKKCMRENTLDQLRDGKLTTGSSTATMDGGKSGAVVTSTGNKKAEKKDTASSSSRTSHKKEQVQLEDEEQDSDGGFFEE
ncbi:hypothetical protein UA08_04220 [Talaromyces atroroseus]|uniref:rRNA-processing protein EFG1 n=1 Tax=Talaromyces atroroseus TaxID=1441469 RepID=A0A1Q5Q8N4_TALAT|nr:hypothetical protein UA08_04220 [Talaromyces atroroseus]OKL60471.1 hypothetical protein UA08_04220 [Talaromyces atroroseus]